MGMVCLVLGSRLRMDQPVDYRAARVLHDHVAGNLKSNTRHINSCRERDQLNIGSLKKYKYLVHWKFPC